MTAFNMQANVLRSQVAKPSTLQLKAALCMWHPVLFWYQTLHDVGNYEHTKMHVKQA